MTLLLAATVLLPASSTAADAVLLAWAPVPATGVVEYQVFGDEDGALVYLGSTYATAFSAPAGFERYQVKYRTPEGQGDVEAPCVFVHQDPPDVEVVLSC